MATLKVNVNKLNVRTSPVKDFDNKENVIGVLQKNAVFESVRVIENELGSWHVNEKGDTISGNYVSTVEGDIPPELMKYHDKIPKIFLDFHLGKLWQLPMQEGLKVGIIEQGHVKKHPAIKAGIKILKWKEDDQQGQDGKARVLIEEQAEESGAEINHTTTMALIIAGNDPENGIIGVAPGVKEIYSYSLLSNQATPNEILEALQAMEAKNVKLINMSYSVTSDTFKVAEELQEKITRMKQDGFVIIAATGNNSCHERSYYPAAYNDIISVTGVYKDLTRDRNSNFWEGVKVCMCTDYYLNSTFFEKSNATSGATATITGSIAHVLNIVANQSEVSNKIMTYLSQLNKVVFEYDELKVPVPLFDGKLFFDLINK